MTFLVAGISLIITMAMSAGLVSVGAASADDTHVQLAADAAALAAAAESGPGGSGQPAAAAHRYAALNGARVVSCICEAGATAVQVTVAIGDAAASARAEIDPSMFVPADLFTDLEGLHPDLRAAALALIQASGGAVRVVSGFRSRAEQSTLWAQALDRYGAVEMADDWVARPGSSMHERGLAIDLGGDLDLARSLAATLGLPLVQPLENEPWHFELVGARESVSHGS